MKGRDAVFCSCLCYNIPDEKPILLMSSIVTIHVPRWTRLRRAEKKREKGGDT